ncbi:protein phosphatase 1 regulatory subunit 42-like isoform X2 [Prorops nasuta]|uniref:protein phosphatase 1 regulatory subunit 42-like isoform X2 n=1 Tax=Prorops nasuta TaxID=863751 RepID=UPI0034CF1DE6
MKLTADCVRKKLHQLKSKKSLRADIKKDDISKATHLHMSNMFISSIGNLDVFTNLRVIDLRNNLLIKIENLHFAVNLTHLHLQHNCISKIENLEKLENLQKLYLGYNNIWLVEGLEHLINLKELYVEHQKLLPQESFSFDPKSTKALSANLKVLNISSNRLTSLMGIKCLYQLEVLEAQNNFIKDIKDLSKTINTLINLQDLQLQGNPVTLSYRYRESMIANSQRLINLDNWTITELNRRFIKTFKVKQELRQKKKKNITTLRDDITKSLNLPPAFEKSISRAIFQQPESKISLNVESINGHINRQLYPPWISTIKLERGSQIAPRPFWRNQIKTTNSSVPRSMSKPILLPKLEY